MLILSRKVGEKIMIGEGITVVVSRVAGDRVTLGFEAPHDVRILRGELRPFDDRGAPGGLLLSLRGAIRSAVTAASTADRLTLRQSLANSRIA